MTNWESHRGVLEELYLNQQRPLRVVMQHMENTCSFKASKAQYETQFKKWDWRKNMNDNEWKYVAWKYHERQGRSSAVYFHGKRVASPKIKKEVIRHFHPNDKFNQSQRPRSPRGVIVCTPPPNSPDDSIGTFPGPSYALPVPCNRLVSQRLRIEEIQSTAQTAPIIMAPQVKPVPMFASEAVLSQCLRQGSVVGVAHAKVPARITLENLPFFKFQDIMRSTVVERGFEHTITFDSNYVTGAWTPSTFHPSQADITTSHTERPPWLMEIDESSSLVQDLPSVEGSMQLCIPLGASFLSRKCGDLDTLDFLKILQSQLPKFLSAMPQRNREELPVTLELLLGPPTVQAARRLVEILVYFASNNLVWFDGIDDLVRWMIQNIPWVALKPILSVKLRTIQAFSERFLMSATEVGNVAIVRELLETPHLRTLVRSSGRIIVCAVENSNVQLVRLLLNAGTSPNSASTSSKTPRPLSVVRTVEIAQLLIKAGADVNGIGVLGDHMYGPVLLQVVARGDVRLAMYLISVGADVNVPGVYYSGSFTALSLALDSGQAEMVKLMLRAGSEVNNTFSMEPIRILRRQCRPTDWNQQLTALQLASGAGNLEIITLLLRHGSDINTPASGKHGKTALYAATVSGCVEAVNLLLEHGADVNAPGNNDIYFPKTVLHAAVEMNNLELVKTFMDAKGDVNARSFGDVGSSILASAKANADCAGIAKLLEGEGAIDDEPAAWFHRQVELRTAVINSDLNRVKELVDIGVRITMKIIPGDLPEDREPRWTTNREKRTILHWALDFVSEIDVFRYLVDQIPNVNLQNHNSTLQPILHKAVEAWEDEAVQILIDAGADVNSVAYNSPYWCETPLMVAAREHNCDAISLLVRNGAEVNATAENTGCTTALQAALSEIERPQHRYLATFQHLLNHGALINARIADRRGRSELALAVQTGDTRVVQHLLRLGADVNSPPASCRGRTALQAAAGLTPPNLEMIQALLEAGANVNAPAGKKGGLTALQAAAQEGNFEIARLLIESGADVNAPGTTVNGKSSLEAAIRKGRLDMVHLLLEAGADVHLICRVRLCPREKRLVNAADLARENGYIAIVEMIQDWERTHRPGEAQSTMEINGGAEMLRGGYVEMFGSDGEDDSEMYSSDDDDDSNGGEVVDMFGPEVIFESIVPSYLIL